MNDFEFPYTYGGRHISEYCDAIKECAEQFGCRFIDLYNTQSPYDTIDGFHANSEGMQAIAEAVLNELNN
jgi:lysophospholipase L1-like esterase